jgi:hypothetical protein
MEEIKMYSGYVVNPNELQGDDKFNGLWNMPIDQSKPITYIYWDNPAFRDMPTEKLPPDMADYKIRRNKRSNEIRTFCYDYAMKQVKRIRHSGSHQFCIDAQGLRISGRKYQINSLANNLGTVLSDGDWSLDISSPQPGNPIKPPQIKRDNLAKALGYSLKLYDYKIETTG